MLLEHFEFCYLRCTVVYLTCQTLKCGWPLHNSENLIREVPSFNYFFSLEKYPNNINWSKKNSWKYMYCQVYFIATYVPIRNALLHVIRNACLWCSDK